MSLNLSLDLSDASLAELSALLSAARAAGAQQNNELRIEGTVLTIEIAQPEDKPAPQHPRAEGRGRPERPLGESTIRSIIDALNDRIDPPRGSFGSFHDPDSNGR